MLDDMTASGEPMQHAMPRYPHRLSSGARLHYVTVAVQKAED